MSQMKIHMERVRENKYGGHHVSTLCGRMNKECEDGINSIGKREDVTCKMCIARFRWLGLVTPPKPSAGKRGGKK